MCSSLKVLLRCRRIHRILFVVASLLLWLLHPLILLDSGISITDEINGSLVNVSEHQGSSIAPRIVFLVIQTQFSPGWCRMLLSSFMSKVSVVTIGLGMNYTHAKRPQWVLEYINQEGLADHDIVVVFDGGDTIFTGARRVQRALSYFMAKTPPTAAKFNATAVHQGKATAPLLFASDSLCFTPQLELVVPDGPTHFVQRCLWWYGRMFTVTESIPDQQMVRSKRVKYRYLNAGGYVGRVWALRAALTAYTSLAAMHRNWTCDQSIWALLYTWSILQKPEVESHLRIPYGVVSLDYNHRFFFNPYRGMSVVPAILHFPGRVRGWRRSLWKYIHRTTWFHELWKDPRLLRETKRLLRCAKIVKVRGADGLTHTHRYGKVCSVEDALNATWLKSPLKK